MVEPLNLNQAEVDQGKLMEASQRLLRELNLPPTDSIDEARILIQELLNDNQEMHEYVWNTLLKVCGENSSHGETPCYSMSS